MKKIFKKNFPNKKKFFWSIFFILFFFLIIIIPTKFFEQKKISEKNKNIKEILVWSVETYKKNFWEYPENLNKIEEEKIISDINLLKNKEKIFYKKNWSWYFLKIL